MVASDPEVTADQRFPVMCVIPITGTPDEALFYPRLEPGASGLRKRSYALVDQLRSIDKRRVRKVYGELRSSEMGAINDGLALFLGL